MLTKYFRIMSIKCLDKNLTKYQMANQYRNFILFTFLFGSLCLWGQKNKMSFPIEEITIHTDRNIYLSNEKVYFNAFCLTDGKLENPLSQTLYLELFDYKNQVFVQKKYAIKDGRASGNFRVPEELPTNNYYLRAYTAYQRNFEANCYFQICLKIINPKSTGNPISIEENIEPISDKLAQNELIKNASYFISTDKKSYTLREKINLKIEFPTDLVSASVSVRPVAAGKNTSDFRRPALIKLKEDSLQYIPEVRGLGIYGLVQNPETKVPLADIQCVISVLGETSQIHASQTNENGIFTFQLSNLQETQTLFIGTPKGKMDAELLILSDFENEFVDFDKEILSFDSLQHAYIEDLFLQQQLKDAFPPKAMKPAYPKDSIQSFSNLGSPDIIIQTADFINLASLEEIFRDIVPSVKLKGKKNERFFTIFNPDTKKTLSEPLVLLDNVPIRDIEELLKISPTKLERIEVISSNYVLGDYLFSGIISLYTNTDNFADYKWSNTSSFVEYTSIALSEPFKQFDYKRLKNNSSYPDFRSTLYWNPNLNQKENNLFFYASDYCSEYEIIVRGFDKNGAYGENSAIFSVSVH